MIYFDNAATTPLDQEVYTGMLHMMKHVYGNPSSVHSFGRECKVEIEEARLKIASYIKVNASEIYFTSSATEAITTAIYGAVRDSGVKRIISSSIEHHAVLHALNSIKDIYSSTEISFIGVDKNATPNYNEIEELLMDGKLSLVIMMHANNEIGCVYDIETVSNICKKYNALFLTDMVQTFGKYQNDFSIIKPDFAACSAHKFHGPKGIGFLYVSGDIKINPLITGGGQERNMRSGTENTYGIIGMAKAFEVAYRDMEKNFHYISGLKKYMVERLKVSFPGLIYNAASDQEGLFNILSISFPKPYNKEMLIQNLDIKGIAVSGGSACSSGVVGESHVLSAIGANPQLPTVRFSFSKYNTSHEIDKTIDVLMKILL